jgi:hypothetical protein
MLARRRRGDKNYAKKKVVGLPDGNSFWQSL